ncbi:MAG: hypothetical protein ACRENP_24710 [Longimicrobiales bacterium]
MKRTIAFCAALLGGANGLASGQIPGIELTLFPRVGVYKPVGALAEFAASTAELRGATALGMSVELQLPLLPINLRGNLEYVPGADAAINDRDLDVDNALLLLSGDLVFRLLPAVSPIQPYLLAGAGVKKYNFDNAFATALFSFPDDRDWMAHLGAGLGLKLGPLSIAAEVSDYISWFEMLGGDGGKLQNDLFATVGLKIGLF